MKIGGEIVYNLERGENEVRNLVEKRGVYRMRN